MTKTVPMMFTSIGGILGSLYGYLSMGAMPPALIASDIPVLLSCSSYLPDSLLE
jgi:hypothetical protein